MNVSEALEQQVRLYRWATTEAKRPGGFVDEVYHDSRWFDVATQALARADPYYMNTEITQLVVSAAIDLPEVHASTFFQAGQSGFVWLEKPLQHTTGPGDGNTLRAFLWAWGVSGTPEGPADLLIVPWLGWPGTYNCVPWSFFEWFGNETQSEAISRERTDNSIVDVNYAHAIYNFCASFLLFIQQRVLSAPHTPLERHARKRLAHLTSEPLVRVIQLRRSQSDVVRNPSGATEWACRWIVRGHWRQQFYPSTRKNIPKWITPYVKGPTSKPLKPPRATIFAVVR